jgi:tetratricopeptide (TPR) repeat protein
MAQQIKNKRGPLKRLARSVKSPLFYLSIVVFILVLGIHRIFFHQSDVDKGLHELKQAYKNLRSIEARLSGFDYAPWMAQRSNHDGIGEEEASIAYAERLLLDAIYYNPNAESRHGLGVFYATRRHFDKAIAQFELSASYAPMDARLHNDWGTALLEKACSDDRKSKVVEAFSDSLDHLKKALEMDPARLDTLFNLALLYEAQGMGERAEEAWETYLSKDPNSNWSIEAKEKLRRLKEDLRTSRGDKQVLLADFLRAHEQGEEDNALRLLNLSRQPLSGKLITDQLLDSYIDNSLSGRTGEAQQALEILAFAAKLEFGKAKERYSQVLARYYEKQSQNALLMLKRARDLTKQGHEYYTNDEYDRAIGAYWEAREIFGKLGDKAETAASDYWIAYCHTDLPDPSAALPLFMKLTRYCDLNQFRWLHTRCLSGMAASFYAQGKYDEAAKYYRLSLEAAEEMGDPTSVLNSLDSLTELYRSIGNYSRSFEYIHRSFNHSLTASLNPIQRLRHFSILASALASAGFWAGALEYQMEGLRGDVSTIPTNAAVAYAHLGMFYARQKNYNDAIRSIELANDTAKRVNADDLRENL